MEGSQNRKWRWNYWSPQTPLADKFLHGAIVPANAYHRTKFQLPSSNSFRDKEGVPKFNVGDTTPLPPYAGILRVLQVRGKVKQPAKFQHRISMHHAVMRICISHRLSVICAQKWGFWEFWGWRCENIVFWPPKGTTLRKYASVDVSRVKIGSTAWALGR